MNKPQSASIFFNTFLNFNKFLAYEQRDPFTVKSEQEKFPGYSDWDIYALYEYQRISDEKDEEEDALIDDSDDENKKIHIKAD